eukprot:CAMPEP_0198278320 /NCGR_PEP_ID=MMETSP1447-20131203/66316_1 /TAXON_ID=420782 /ORGANISM="Chaetoceros dichaeta, Strain CCMP1751" /LENGTH=148 /DNA_ID=CAMNT_0043973397 /DNA_START=688 /DNA_END=1135 /DNA_ORIENTATION=+
MNDNNGRGSGSTATAFLSVVPPPAATLSDDTVASTSVPHRDNNPTIHTTFLHQNTQTESPPQTITNPQTIHTAKHLINRVRLAAYLVDMPPAELTTDAYAEECRLLANELGDTVTYSEIVGEELNERGYGGLYGIGKAAVCPPQHGLL